MIPVDAFLDELQKIAVVELTPTEKTRQALQFAALGGVSMPVIQGLRSKMLSGSWMGGAKPSRWLPAQVASGMLVGGALPTLRHMIARGNINAAKARVAAEKEMKRLAPEGVEKALQKARRT